MKKIIFFIFFVIILSNFTYAIDYIVDSANVITDKTNIQNELNKINQMHSSIVIIHTVEDLGKVSLSDWDKHYGVEVFNLDKEGNPKLNVMITYFKKQEHIRISTLKDSLIDDETLSPIVNELVSSIRKGKADKGFLDAVISLNAAIDEAKKKETGFFSRIKNKIVGWFSSGNSYDKLVDIYEKTGKIDASLLVKSFLDSEYNIYKSSNEKSFEDLDSFYEAWEKFIEELKNSNYNKGELENFLTVKSESYRILGVSGYNRDSSGVLDAFVNKRIQCRSGTYLLALSALEVMKPEDYSDLLIIFTSGHVLPGMIHNGKLVGFESTVFGPGLKDFGEVNTDKTLRNQGEKIMAVRAVNALFSDVAKEDNLKKKAGNEGVVIDNPGNVINEEGGGSLGKALPSMFSFGEIKIPEGDIPMQTSGSEVSTFSTPRDLYNSLTNSYVSAQINSMEKAYEEGSMSLDLSPYKEAYGNTPGAPSGFEYKGFLNNPEKVENLRTGEIINNYPEITWAIFLHSEWFEKYKDNNGGRIVGLKLDVYKEGKYEESLYTFLSNINFEDGTKAYYKDGFGNKIYFNIIKDSI